MLGGDEERCTEWIFIVVIYGKSIAFYPLLFINLFEITPWYPSLLDVLFSLQIQDPSDPSLLHFANIFLPERISPYRQPCVSNLVKIKTAQEISVSLFYGSIYDPYFLLIFELIWVLNTQFTSIRFWLLNNHWSTRLSLLDNGRAWLIWFRVRIYNLIGKLQLIHLESDGDFPRPHPLTVLVDKPLDGALRSVHAYGRSWLHFARVFGA